MLMTCLFVDNLTAIDFSYVDEQRGIVGESWLVDVCLTGQLGEDGMILDFGLVKTNIKQVLDATYDHKLWIPRIPSLTVTEENQGVRCRWQDTQQRQFMVCSPPCGMLLFDDNQIIKARIERHIESHLAKVLPDHIDTIAIRLRNECIEGAYYHYSHGLKHHEGNCQRIAHGHRSKLEIYLNGERHPGHEQQWANDWQDIYIANREDQLRCFTKDDITYRHFAYQAQQGTFELMIPDTHCYLINTESTVEHLAEHIAQKTFERSDKSDELMIRCYEGIHKGALASINGGG